VLNAAINIYTIKSILNKYYYLIKKKGTISIILPVKFLFK